MTRWLAFALLLAAVAVPAYAEPVLRWSPADGTVPVDGEITLSVMLDEALPIRTIELYIEYEDSLVTSVSGAPGALFNGFNLFQGFEEVDPQNPGLWHGYCVILGATSWATGPGELFRWTIRGALEGVCSVTTFEITLLPPGGGDYPDTVLLPSTITVGDDLTDVAVLPTATPTLFVYPNPFNPTTRVDFDLGTARCGRLDVVDVRGYIVASLWDGTDQSGSRTWNGVDKHDRSLPSGTYFCKLTTPLGVETRKMQLVR